MTNFERQALDMAAAKAITGPRLLKTTTSGGVVIVEVGNSKEHLQIKFDGESGQLLDYNHTVSGLLVIDHTSDLPVASPDEENFFECLCRNDVAGAVTAYKKLFGVGSRDSMDMVRQWLKAASEQDEAETKRLLDEFRSEIARIREAPP